MNTITNIGTASWKTRSGLPARFSSPSAAWAIVDSETGLLLSKDGNTPSTYSRKYIAEEVAPYAADFRNHAFDIELIEETA